jgi:hypothetical protein
VRLPIKQAEALARVRQKFEELRHATGREPTAEGWRALWRCSPPRSKTCCGCIARRSR